MPDYAVGPPKSNAYDDAIAVDCPRCEATAGNKCVNPDTGRPSRSPCVNRLRKAEEQA